MSVILGTTANGEELVVSCSCECDDGIRIKIDKDVMEDIDWEAYAFLTYQSGNFYREQGGVFRCFAEKCKKIWKIIRNKDFYYSEICMTRSDFKKFKEYVNSIGE